MKEIKLTQGKVTIVDDDVYEWASKFKWHAHKNNKNNVFYAERHTTSREGTVGLHREIMNAPDDMEVDHRDGDRLNNQRHNLRIATRNQNQWAYKKPKTDTTSPFRGVCQRPGNKWEARITVNRVSFYLGRFGVEACAARAYDLAAIKYFGEFAQLNLPITKVL